MCALVPAWSGAASLCWALGWARLEALRISIPGGHRGYRALIALGYARTTTAGRIPRVARRSRFPRRASSQFPHPLPGPNERIDGGDTANFGKPGLFGFRAGVTPEVNAAIGAPLGLPRGRRLSLGRGRGRSSKGVDGDIDRVSSMIPR